MSDKTKFLTVLTPPGVLSKVWLNNESQYGKFQASTTVSLEAGKPLMDAMTEMRDTILKVRDLTNDIPIDEFVLPFSVDEAANEVTFKLRMDAEQKNYNTGAKVQCRPIVVDAMKNPINTQEVMIGSGSKGCLSGVGYFTFRKGKEAKDGKEAEPSMGYISIKLKAAQIIELAAVGMDYASDFDTVVDGYDFSAEEGTVSETGFEAQ